MLLLYANLHLPKCHLLLPSYKQKESELESRNQRKSIPDQTKSHMHENHNQTPNNYNQDIHYPKIRNYHPIHD